MGPGGFALCAVLFLAAVCPWAAARPPAGVPTAAWLTLMGRAAACAGGRRPAREIATREPAARSDRSRGPPWPCHRPPAPRPGPAFWLVISSSALLREALHWLVASAMPRYLVHRFLTQRIPTHAHGALSQPIRDRAEWVTAVASHQLALYQVTSRVLDRLFSYPERHNLSRLAFPIHFAGACCHPRHTDGLSGPSRSHIVWCLWGFCSIRSWPSACRRRVAPLMTPIPRLVVVSSWLGGPACGLAG